MTTNRLEIVAEDLLDELALADGLDLDSEIVTRARDEYYRLIDYTPAPDYLAALTAAREVWTTPPGRDAVNRRWIAHVNTCDRCATPSPTFGTAEEAAYRAYLADEALDVYMSAQADEQTTHLAYVAAVASRGRPGRPTAPP